MSDLEGYAELAAKLKALASPREQAQALRASVAEPLRKVAVIARANISRISPGKAAWHRTYRGRIVGAGFAARSIRVKVRLSRDKSAAIGRLGVLKEAFYALQFFEFGTSRIPRQPWLVPAFEQSKNAQIKGVGDVLRKRILRIAAKRAGNVR